MNRDWELIRKLGFYIQENSSFRKCISTVDPEFIAYFEKEKYSPDQVVYNLYQMHDENLFVGWVSATHDGKCWEIERLTSKGHDFIDKASNDKIWRKAMDLLKPVGSFTLDLILPLLTSLIKESIGLH